MPDTAENGSAYRGKGNVKFGGPVKVSGTTIFQRPFSVKGITGGNVPARAVRELMGEKGDALLCAADMATNPNMYHWEGAIPPLNERIRTVLEDFGGDPGMAENLIKTSSGARQLLFALQEHLIAHVFRKAGYDSIIGWSIDKRTKKKWSPTSLTCALPLIRTSMAIAKYIRAFSRHNKRKVTS